MMKLTLLIFIFISKVTISQVDEIVTVLTNCKDSSIINNIDTAICFPNSNRYLKLPKNWCADFYGELPMLHAQKNTDSLTFNVRGYQAWDTFPKDYLFDYLKNETINTRSFEEFNFHNHIFLLIQNKTNMYELYYHMDESDLFENRWLWKFNFKLKNIENENVLCELGYIIKQIVEEYDLRMN